MFLPGTNKNKKLAFISILFLQVFTASPHCAKVYRDMRQRSFQKRAGYQEGRKVRGSRQARAISKSTRFGRKEQEAQWKNAEVDALYKLVAAGVRMPKPYGYFNDTLIMELVTDAAGDPAPRLGEAELDVASLNRYKRPSRLRPALLASSSG